jgi:hypothetical protein
MHDGASPHLLPAFWEFLNEFLKQLMEGGGLLVPLI